MKSELEKGEIAWVANSGVTPVCTAGAVDTMTNTALRSDGRQTGGRKHFWC